jgi:hypothetical protein
MGVLRRRGGLVASAAVLAIAAAACQAAPNAGTAIGTDYAVNVWSGWVQRWNPCAPVHYRVNDALAAGDKGQIFVAVQKLAQATGIRFVYDGTTAYVPRSDSWSRSPAPLVISFAHHRGQTGGTDLLAGGNQLGEGGFQSSYTTVNGRITTYKITKGYAVIDADGYARSSAGVRRAVLLHELGHAVGLNHAKLPTEIMYPSIGSGGPTAYSAGDLAGLRVVGRPAGCLS